MGLSSKQTSTLLLQGIDKLRAMAEDLRLQPQVQSHKGSIRLAVQGSRVRVRAATPPASSGGSRWGGMGLGLRIIGS